MNKIILDNQILKLSFNLSTIKTKNQFLRKMQEFFEFPAYFGGGFDALNDCMRDLSWFCQDNLIIEFYHLERIDNVQLREFIQDCLVCYQEYWQTFNHKNVSILIL
ncbi:MAG: barstar family protein [Moraxella sp.]|uniref:barstar family protein n=1 Tax=Moraxella sp. TaxID=479 RepID=UPI0026DCE6E8|nr:barstar family protein [Moraxella sp.]MDO4450914.1 barstar family protein [Moraxella sp.]